MMVSPKKLPAAALWQALMVMVLIGLVGTTLLTGYGLHHEEIIAHRTGLQLASNSLSGLHWLLAQPDSFDREERVVSLFGGETDSVRLSRFPWGWLDVARVTAFSGRQQHTRMCLLGRQHQKLPALYLADHHRPLSLAGTTSIKGTAYLPTKGVKRAYLEGQHFSGKTLIDGKQKRSANQLPPLDSARLWRCQQYLAGRWGGQDSLWTGQLLPGDTLEQSFEALTLVVYRKDSLTLPPGHYRGNIMVISATSITIGKGVVIDGIQLYAPQVVIQQGVQGAVQAFAGHSLVVDSGVVLDYPTVLGMIGELPGTHPQLRIAKQAEVSGSVFCLPRATQRQGVQLFVDKMASVQGLVYCSGAVQLEGTITGSLYADRLVLQTPSSVYENHLLNATLDGENLPQAFRHAQLLSSIQPLTPVQWLH